MKADYNRVAFITSENHLIREHLEVLAVEMEGTIAQIILVDHGYSRL